MTVSWQEKRQYYRRLKNYLKNILQTVEKVALFCWHYLELLKKTK